MNKRKWLAFFLGVFCCSLYGQSNKSPMINYNKTIKIILKEIDYLPPLFHTIIDRPKNIEVYAGYDLSNSELIPFPNNHEKFKIIYETGSKNEIKSVCFIESGMGYGGGYTTEEKYNIRYDNQGRISTIKVEDGWFIGISFSYQNNIIVVKEIGSEDLFKYTFDINKSEYQYEYKNKISIKKFTEILKNSSDDKIFETPVGQNYYTRIIYKYDEKERLTLFICAHYDDQDIEILRHNPWNRFYKLNY